MNERRRPLTACCSFGAFFGFPVARRAEHVLDVRVRLEPEARLREDDAAHVRGDVLRRLGELAELHDVVPALIDLLSRPGSTLTIGVHGDLAVDLLPLRLGVLAEV
jgi:hypothetical protein